MYRNARIALASLSITLVAPLNAADFQPDRYHEQNCTRCHDSTVYTRDDRRIGSYPALQSQVQRCDANLGTRLFPDDLGSLVDYLNDRYYHFQK
jgi:hypothetical protein